MDEFWDQRLLSGSLLRSLREHLLLCQVVQTHAQAFRIGTFVACRYQPSNARLPITKGVGDHMWNIRAGAPIVFTNSSTYHHLYVFLGRQAQYLPNQQGYIQYECISANC